ncbi:MAG: orotidine-5'-phosphate decarboxylase [Gammaproteobacteria bacterium]|nr:orotidine-5'-phosphate decarboxylase [Gammaproteobacteria bacterium]MDH5801242.1 orotidine-5'-phosphate decarboxylase [Gammaproteobacteria bacterium]
MNQQIMNPRIIVALDYADAATALKTVSSLDPSLCRLKVGKELFTTAGPQFVEQIQKQGFAVFLDLKFHDIPNTVAKACQAAAQLGVWMVNVHAVGGRKMMQGAAEAIAGSSQKPLLIAVTVLTSMDEQDLQEIGFSGSPQERVSVLAQLAQESGLDGVVCSPWEVQSLREQRGARFTLVTPGVRPAGAAHDDQKRIMTPADAIQAGSDYLVIGRPITQAADPLQALQAIHQEIQTAHGEGL